MNELRIFRALSSTVLSFIAASLLLWGSAIAQVTVDERQISGVAGQKIGPGAAQAGTAQAFGSVTTDVFSLYYNPAGSVFAGEYAAGFMHHEWIDDIRSEYFGFIWRPEKVSFGVSLLYNSVGDIERREIASTEPISLFDAQDFSAAITTGFFISPELSFGLTGKVIYQKIDVSSGTAIAVDAGAYYKFMPEIEIGMSVSNLGSKMKLEDQEDDLPSVARAGGTYTYRTLKFGINAVTPADDKVHFHFGAENVFNDILAVRAGYASGYDVRDLAFGFGIRHDFASLDYAYTPIDSDLGDSHRFSLTVSWR
jgi:hypothetical protein